MSGLISENYPESQRKLVKEFVAVSFNLELNSFCDWLKNFYIVTTFKFKCVEVQNAYTDIARISARSNNLEHLESKKNY